MNDTSVTLFNTGLPVVLIACAAGGLPWVLSPRTTRSQGRVMLAIGMSCVLLVGVSAGLFALFDKRSLWSGETLMQHGVVAWVYLRGSASAALIWAPILALTWLGLAQRVERLRGQDMAREARL